MNRKILVLLLCVLSLTLAVVLASCESVGIIVTNPVDLVRDTNSAQSDKTPISTAEQSASQQTAQVHEHKYNSRVVKEPTCDEGGQIEYYCDCGERYREETNQLNHILSIQNVSWSLDYEATARLRCTLCGAEFYVSCNVVECVGAEPTCDADGTKIYYASIDIRDSEGLPSNVEDVPLPEVSVKETLPAFGHEFEEEWVVLSEATCTEEGEAVRYCKHDRNHVQTQILLPSGHNYVVDEVVEPTCYEDGYILYRCELCQDYYTIDTHTSHEYEVTSFVAATCEENGYITYTCNNCNDRYSEVIPKGNHNYVVEVVTPATKEQEGLKQYTCTNCGDSYDETIPQIGEGSLVLMVQDSMPWTYSGDNALLNELQRD